MHMLNKCVRTLPPFQRGGYENSARCIRRPFSRRAYQVAHEASRCCASAGFWT